MKLLKIIDSVFQMRFLTDIFTKMADLNQIEER